MSARLIELRVPSGEAIRGDLALPDAVTGATGLVIFAHGSGSSRHSQRNRFVAETLRHRGLATLLIDLFTDGEAVLDERTAQFRFDIGLLASRLELATKWAERDPAVRSLLIGYFGASTGAAAALVAAARHAERVTAVVSRGGRPDLAGSALADVRAPTLLIVGGRDDLVLELNQLAARELRCYHRLVVVPGATHLFPEPGALEQVARLASDWFATYLCVDSELSRQDSRR